MCIADKRCSRLHTFLAHYSMHLFFQAKETENIQQQQKQIELLQQQKETELKLLAAEHLSALRAKDAELLEAS